MATKTPGSSTDIAEIQRRMAQIRRDMHQEVQGAVQGARSLTDWKSLVRGYPWLSLSIAAAVGYVIVPRRREPAPTVVVAAPAPEYLAGSPRPANDVRSRPSGFSLVGTAFGLLTPIAVRVAQNYALNYFEQWLATHPLMAGGPSLAGDEPRRGSEPGRSAGVSSRLGEYR